MEQPKRPDLDDIIKDLAKAVGQKIYEWGKGIHALDRCISDAEDILDCYYNADGYELAKDFERKGYNSDSELVDILDDVEVMVYDLLREATYAWVTQNDIRLELEPGTVVSFMDHQLKQVTGEIVKQYPRTAQYGIWHDGLKGQKGMQNAVVNKENVSVDA